MLSKIIGTLLLVAAAAITYLLVAGGHPLFPHLVGPATLTVIGVLLLARRRKAPRATQ